MRRRGRVRTILGRLLRGIVVVLAVWFLSCALGLVYLHFLPPLTTTVQIQRRIEALFARTPYTKRYDYEPLARISPNLQHAVVAAEDSGFYDHSGIDWAELGAAMRANLRRGRVWRGGSTITQQLVKNLFLVTDRFLPRKLLELPLALLAEVILSKKRILELYLNVIEWGPGVYGAEAAARYHYNVSAASLSREQAARLAACIPSPRRRTPARMSGFARIIMRRMAVMGW